MKIACIAKKSHPAKLGGVESFQRNLSLILNNYDFRIYSYKTDKEKIFSVPKLFEIDSNNSLAEKFLLKLLGKKRYLVLLLKKWKPDVIIINTPNDLKFLKNLKSKIILVQHGSFEAYMNGTFDNLEVVSLIQNRLDRYIFLSDYDVEKFNEFLGLSQDRVKAIRHICNVSSLKGTKIKEKKIVVLSRLHKDKKIEYIVKAMTKLQDFSLKIYGDGEEKESLKKLINKMNLKNVKLMGRTSQISSALDQESIFVMASDFEGYPISCIEAARRGLPIILRDTFSSAKDIVQGNGVLLGKEWNEDEFVEAVHKTYNNYKEYSSKSLELGKRHDIKIIRKEWDNLFKELKK